MIYFRTWHRFKYGENSFKILGGYRSKKDAKGKLTIDGRGDYWFELVMDNQHNYPIAHLNLKNNKLKIDLSSLHLLHKPVANAVRTFFHNFSNIT